MLLARLACRTGAWAVAAVLFATSPRIGIMGSSFSDADLAQAAALLGAFAVAVPRATEDLRDVRVDAWYAGVLSGVALGITVSAVPPALVALALLMLRARALPPPARLRQQRPWRSQSWFRGSRPAGTGTRGTSWSPTGPCRCTAQGLTS